MTKKRRLTIAECKKQFPEAWQDANEKQDKRVKGKIELAMVHMINEGEHWADAKLKALNIALNPDHFEALPAGGEYPKLAYHESGKMKTVEDEEEWAELQKQKGWSLKPLTKHIDKLQLGSTPRDERIDKLTAELEAELKARDKEKAAA